MDSEVSTFLYLCESIFEKSPCKNWAYYLYNVFVLHYDFSIKKY